MKTALALLGLLLAGDQARAQGEPLGGEQRMRQEAVDRVKEEMGPSFVPPARPASAAPAVGPRKIRKVSAQASTGPRCLPTCATNDGRFLAIAGSNFRTLSPPELALEISVPAGSPSFTIGIFDGDGGEYQSDGLTAYWDSGVTALFDYTLYADPLANGTGAMPVELAPGEPVILSSDMPDNDWRDFTVPTGQEAQSPSGNYFYVLRIRLIDESQTTLNAFKVRSSSNISGVTLRPVPLPFSYIAPWTALDDILTIYPAFPLSTPTTYDGSFTFYIDVPASQRELAIWDGDFDHGNWDLTDQDTDDQDTEPTIPTWSTPEVAPEGVADGALLGTGDPADDDNPADFGVYTVRSPAVRYSLHLPDGSSFDNDNPSGNQEWEQFKLSTDPFDPSEMDHSTPTLPPGTYELRMQGVDMLNLNALLLPFRLLCVDEEGVPCTPVRPFLVGDSVLTDCEEENENEPGIGGVTLELLDELENVIATTVTDADGLYSFPVEAGVYSVQVAESNFEPGGPLDGYNPTTSTYQTSEVTDDNVLTYDFGFCGGLGSLGDTVWYDADGNGIQDPGEPGLSDVLLELYDADGNAIDLTVTDGDGFYTFSNLAPGTYTVRIDPFSVPPGLVPTADLDGHVTTPHEATAAVGAGEDRTDVDFGYGEENTGGNASIGDRVWYDSNGDGVQDGGEAGLPGVTVNLLDGAFNPVATTVTGANGIYTFGSLSAGTYTVAVDASTLPPGVAPTYDFDGLGTPNTTTLTVANGDARTEIDFGYRGNGSLGDRVWYDTNGDGVQDAGEAGLTGVTVELLDGGGNLVATTATGANGIYTFANLAADTYTVRVVAATLPAGAVPTYDLDGIATAHTAVATLAAGASRTDVDFGYRGNASLGDRIWYDFDGDGVQDAGETGLTGIGVELVDGGGNVIATTTTAADGIYGFGNLLGGTYTVRVVTSTLPAGSTPTYDLDGAFTPHTTAVTLAAGTDRTDVDFGYRGTASLGDRIWRDTDGDGVQDAGENGLTGVSVELLDGGGNVIATTTTGADGIYGFSFLLDGTYTVRVVAATLPAGSTPTYDLDGIGSAHTAAATITGGASRDDVDFGYRGTGSIGDRVWNDTDGDGVQDAGETGLTGVSVELLDGDGNVIATTTTAADGIYGFGNLFDGTYTVRVVSATLPAGVAPTYDLDGTATAHTAVVTLAGGVSRDDVDFGYRGTGSIGDRVWYDANGNGAQDAGENGLAGVSVELLDNGGNVIATTATGADGLYTFSNLGAGTYTVRVVAATLPAGVAPTYDLDGTGTAHTAVVVLAGGQNRDDADFGYQGTATIGDRVWNDADADDVQDAGEAGINGVTVRLLDGGGNVIATTVTTGDGNYTFGGLLPGNYTVQIDTATLPANFGPTYDLDGVGTPHQASFTLSGSRTDVDFGYRGPEDTDNCAIAADADPAWGGVNGGHAFWMPGIGTDFIFTPAPGGFVTSSDGTASLTGTVRRASNPNQAFTVSIQLSGFSASIPPGSPRQELDPSAYSDNGGPADPSTWTYYTVFNGTLTGIGEYAGAVVTITRTGASFQVGIGANNKNVNFGASGEFLWTVAQQPTSGGPLQANGQGDVNVDLIDCPPATASIGDRIWEDVNGDGVQDAGENGLTGVTVELLDEGGNVVATTTTGTDGIYSFDNLAAGVYSVRVDSTTLPAGSAPTYDLDGTATANVAVVMLTPGQTRDDVDFGYRGTASIGDRLWYDANGDGVQDGGENGLTGVSVELLDGGGNVIATTTTGADGIYTFDNLSAGSYTVRVVAATLPAGVAPTYDLDGTGTANTAAVTVTGGQTRDDVDFGYRGTASIGDRLWYDADGDGVQDAGENGLTGVSVELLDGGGNVIATTTTGADGIYTFSNLAAGSYTVRVVSSTLPAGSAPTYDLDGTGTAHTAAVSVTGGQTRDDVDFGYRGTASIGDRLWYDADGDGVQDPGENGLTGVTVELLDGGGNVIATTTTGADGIYTFANLAAGSYTVRVVSSTLPAGSAPTYDLDGTGTAHTAAVTVTGGQTRDDVDFGYRGTASVGDRLWYDADGDGVQDPGENGLTGVSVELLDGGGNVIATTTTGADGIYTFANLAAGSYTVRVVASTLPAGSAPTYDLDGTGTAHTAAVTVTGGQNRDDVDFGYRGTASIGDRLWYDADGDGVQDPGENGLTGVSVELLDGGGNVIATTTTGADGIYTFANLAAGSYTVRVVASTLPAGSAPTYDLDGIATANTAAVTLTAGQTRTDVDFGYRGTASIGDRLWNDIDGDGVQDAGEAGLTGVSVELLDGGGNVIATTTTGADGIYTFSNLAAGSYTVRVVSSTLPAGSAPTYDLDGIATANTAAVTLTAGQTRTDVDFGYRGTASIGDRLWNDVDGDGVQDAGEAGLTGVTVELLDGGGNVIATTTTGADGIYTFSNLAAGSYTVRVVSSTLPAGSAPTYDLDGIATANTAAVTLTAGQTRTDVDFGYRGTASIGDRLWNDIDGDGVQDAGEAGLTGVSVELLDGGGNVVATTTTGANGIYTFSNLAAGSYTVRVVSSTLPAGSAPTYDLDGVATAHTAAVTVTAGQTRTDVDFGYRGTASIGDRLWNDTDGDGVQDAGETGLTGVTVELLSGTTVVATTTTGADGIYTFSNLAAGSYTVRVVSSTLPAGSTPTYDLDGTATAHTAAVTVTAGQARTDVDFGYRGNGSIGDRLWYDADGDGVQDAGEPGLFSTTVELLSGTTVVATTTTDSNGIYTFTNLPAGTYTVRVVTSTFPVGGLNPTYDLDGTGTAHTATVTLAAGQTRTDVDFGYRGTGSIGDRLWYDSDGDGVQDAGEPGLFSTTVELLLGTTVIATTTTDANGIYTFTNLPATSYTVRVVTSTFPVGGLNPTYDLDGTGTPHTAAVTLAAGQNRTDVDFGYRGTRSVGDRVWKDTDGDGVQDAGETGINGVTVRLFLGTTEVASTVTAGDGNYTFTNLPETTFTVRIDTATLPAGMVQTYDLDGLATPHQATFALTTSRTDVDFGYRVPPASCTPGYYKDHFNSASFSNNDGNLSWSGAWIESDSAGSGVSSGNVTVGSPYAGYLFLRDYPDTGSQPSAARQADLSDFTSATMSFVFHVRTALDPSDTVVVEISNNGGSTYTVLDTLNGFTGTFEDDRIYNLPSSYLVSNFRVRFRVTSGYQSSNELFKLDWIKIDGSCAPPAATGSIGDRVWLDADGDGTQDGSETGINGVTVQLLNSSGTVIATTTTAGNGNYTFSNLAAGSYSVRIVTSTLPAGAIQTYDLDGTGTAHVAAVTLATGQNRTDADFGYKNPPSCTVGYFKDHFNSASFSNNDGNLSWSGAWIESDSAGSGVSNGNVTVGSPYAGYLFLRDYPDTGTQPSAARQADLSDFTSATLSFVFHVRTALDPSDTVVVEISNNGGSSYTVLDTLNGFTGTFEDDRIYNLPSSYLVSNFRVRFRVTSGYQSSNELFKLDWIKIDGSCAPPAATGSIGDRVWLDADGDGTQDSSETGINGVTVQLLNSSGTVIATTTTAGNGNYTFSNLAAGSYSVRIVTSTLPAGAIQTYDLDGTGTAHVAAVTLATGQNRTDADFGYKNPPSCTAGYFKDHFDNASFSNNDGSRSWSGAWIESDTAGSGVSNGNVTVGSPYAGYLFLRDYPDTGTQPSAARQANLTGFSSATLTFEFHVRTAVDPSDAVVVEVSNNGGSTYTVLDTLTGFTGTYEDTRTYNVSTYISSNFRVRFRVTSGYQSSNELFKLDWIKLDGSCTSPEPPPGTGTLGYWKNHSEDWPVEQITIGGRVYTKSQAISLMGTSGSGDKTYDMFKQLVAAKLNVLVGNEAGCITSTIASADSWMATYPVGSNVKGNHSAWTTGGPLHEKLDDYNNGLLCAPHRD